MYLGQVVQIFNGTDGFDGTQNISQVKPNKLIAAESVTFEYGPLQKEGGTTPYNVTPISGSPSILAGIDYWPDPATQRMIVYGGDGKLYKDSGSATFPVTLATGYTGSGVIPVFVEAGKEAAANNKKLFILTGKDVVKYLSGDGTTLTALTSTPVDWSGGNQPSCGVVHQSRAMFAGNANQPHTIYYSGLADHSDLNANGNGIIQVFPGEGRGIVAMASYKGLLIVWKNPRGVYIVNSQDPNIANWTVTRVTLATGAASPNGWCLVDNDIIWMDAVGNIQMLSATLNFGFLESINLSQTANLRPWLDSNVNFSQIQFVHAIYYPLKRQARFRLAGFGSTAQNLVIIVDYQNLQQPRFWYSTMDTMDSMWTRLDSNSIARPTSGDTQGQIWLRDQPVKSIGVNGSYISKFQTPHLDLSTTDPTLATKRKLGQFLELVVEPTGQWNVIASIVWDGMVKQTIPFNLGITGAALGSFVLGTDKLAGLAVNSTRKRIVGSGKRFSLVIENDQAGQDYSISTAYLSYVPGNEKA